MGYDDILPLAGGFGKHQWKLFVLFAFPTFLSVFYKLGNVILLAEPNYRCLLPYESKNVSFYLNDTEMERWYQYDNNTHMYEKCTLLNNANSMVKCKKFVFDENQYGKTGVIEFELTCNRAYLIATTNFLSMFGYMIGSFIFGLASDRWGRKYTIICCSIFHLFIGVILIFSTNIWMFLLLKFLFGMLNAGIYYSYFILAIESTEPSKRVLMGSAITLFFTLGTLLIGFLGYISPSWKHLQLAFTSFGIPVFLYIWLVPESGRWLISKNKFKEAKDVIHKIAKDNNVTIQRESVDISLTESLSEKRRPNVSIFDVIKYPNLRKRIAISLTITTIMFMAFFGIAWNIGKLNGNLYINVALMGSVDLVGVIVINGAQKFGRRVVFSTCICTAGISLLLSTVWITNNLWRLAWTLMGKLFTAASLNLSYVYCSEIYPTVFRNAGIGLNAVAGSVGSMISSYIFYLDVFWRPLPTVVCGLFLIVAGFMCLLLPETYKKKLPETLKDGENFGKN